MNTQVKILTVCIFSALYSFNITAQVSIINHHAGESNKRDLNQAYINSETSAIKTLNDSYFEVGYVLKGSDTLACEIYLPKHKMNDDFFLFIIARMPNDSNYVFSPKDISGYTVNGMTMRAHRSAVSGDTNYFFIKMIEKGDITLYERTAVPSDNEYMYYFEKQGTNELQYIAPYKENIAYRLETYSKNSPMLSKYNNVDEALLKAALSEYLKDCKTICHKLTSNFYTVDDVKTIIRDYNKCRK
jgi:hypothetical protein